MNIFEGLTVTEIESVYDVHSVAGKTLNMTNRRNYALSLCADGGEIHYVKDGRRIISDMGTAVLIPKGASYTLERIKTGRFPLINFDLSDSDAFDDIISFKISNPDGYIRIYEELKKSFELHRSRMRSIARLYELFAKLEEESKITDSLVFRARAVMLRTYTDPSFKVSELASKMAISEVYLRRAFLSEFGVSPKAYLCSLRLERARLLLSEGVYTVGEISEACGYSSVYHFSRAFKENTGISPSAYGRGEKSFI